MTMGLNQGEYGKMADTCRKHDILMGAFINAVEKALYEKELTALMLIRAALSDYQRNTHKLRK